MRRGEDGDELGELVPTPPRGVTALGEVLEDVVGRAARDVGGAGQGEPVDGGARVLADAGGLGEFVGAAGVIRGGGRSAEVAG